MTTVYLLTRGAYEGEWDSVGVFASLDEAKAYANSHAGDGDWEAYREGEPNDFSPHARAMWQCDAEPDAVLFSNYIIEEHVIGDPSYVWGRDENERLSAHEYKELEDEGAFAPCTSCGHPDSDHHWGRARTCRASGCSCVDADIEDHKDELGKVRRALHAATINLEHMRHKQGLIRVQDSDRLLAIAVRMHNAEGHASPVHDCDDDDCFAAHIIARSTLRPTCPTCIEGNERMKRQWAHMDKLSEDEKQAIKERYTSAGGMTHRSISEEYDLPLSGVSKLLKGLRPPRTKAEPGVVSTPG